MLENEWESPTQNTISLFNPQKDPKTLEASCSKTSENPPPKTRFPFFMFVFNRFYLRLLDHFWPPKRRSKWSQNRWKKELGKRRGFYQLLDIILDHFWAIFGSKRSFRKENYPKKIFRKLRFLLVFPSYLWHRAWSNREKFLRNRVLFRFFRRSISEPCFSRFFLHFSTSSGVVLRAKKTSENEAENWWPKRRPS